MELFGAIRTNLGRAVLALILVLAQLHFCETTYVRASGATCQECLELPVHVDDIVGLSDTHSDCHDCCEIKECETPNGVESPATQSQITFEFAILPEPLVVPDFGQSQNTRPRFYFTRNAPATGPPTIHLSRGPPTDRFVQPSAGCGITLLA